MNILPIIDAAEKEMQDIYEDLHAHPELGFEEVRTSAIVAEKLREFGVDEVHTGLGKTGVVGIIKGKSQGNRRVGLRADMDALPIDEISSVPFSSTKPGIMHACGHDGHTTMLLGAAKHLAKTREFDGTAVLIFQPAEEGLGGARQMIADGLFEKFPCDEIFGIHNSPNGNPGTYGICKGAAMAGAMFFDAKITGCGSHAAAPQNSKDTIVITSSLVSQLQTIVSRNIAPLDNCVLSVTQVHAGSAYNIVPENAHISGTVRYFKDEICALAMERMKMICDGISTAYEIEVNLDMRNVFDTLINDEELSDAYIDAAADVLQQEIEPDISLPVMGSEDFADMLRVVPGAYIRIGHTGTVGLHNPSFVLGQEVLPIGASIIARILEKRLPLRP